MAEIPEVRLAGSYELNTVNNKDNTVSTNGLKSSVDEHNYSYAEEGFCFVCIFWNQIWQSKLSV